VGDSKVLRESVAEALRAYVAQSSAPEITPAERVLSESLEALLWHHLPELGGWRSEYSPDGLVVWQVIRRKPRVWRVTGKLYLLPSGVDPFRAFLEVDARSVSLRSYRLHVGYSGERPQREFGPGCEPPNKWAHTIRYPGAAAA
jgi:hypothetical protein